MTLRGMLPPALVTSNVELVFEAADGIPVLLTDEGKVTQIVRNFIHNALKFTERGEVRIKARHDRENDAILLSVSDTGIGIAAEDHERIFDEFTQVEHPVQSRVKGTGLGLPLCRKLAALLGGTIELTSAPGIGSTFSLRVQRRYLPPGREEGRLGGEGADANGAARFEEESAGGKRNEPAQAAIQEHQELEPGLHG
jgi:signal transduction histidine kinase